jgi:hypothetical protein
VLPQDPALLDIENQTSIFDVSAKLVESSEDVLPIANQVEVIRHSNLLNVAALCAGRVKVLHRE